MHDLGSTSCGYTPLPSSREVDDALDAAGVPHHDERGSLSTAQRVQRLSGEVKALRSKWDSTDAAHRELSAADVPTRMSTGIGLAPPIGIEAPLPEHFLHLAHMRGTWMQSSDEWFVRRRVGGPDSPWVTVSWRHGPGIANSKPETWPKNQKAMEPKFGFRVVNVGGMWRVCDAVSWAIVADFTSEHDAVEFVRRRAKEGFSMPSGSGGDGSVSFEESLRELINQKSRENGSNTPDYVLADYLCRCLESFDRAVKERQLWHGDRPATKGLAESILKDCASKRPVDPQNLFGEQGEAKP